MESSAISLTIVVMDSQEQWQSLILFGDSVGQMPPTSSLKGGITHLARGCLFVSLWLWEEHYPLCRINPIKLCWAGWKNGWIMGVLPSEEINMVFTGLQVVPE